MLPGACKVPTKLHHDAIERAVVADAGPLLHLDELDALQVLSDFHEIFIVPAVQEEVTKHRPAVLKRCANFTLLESAPDSDEVTALTPLQLASWGARSFGLLRAKITRSFPHGRYGRSFGRSGTGHSCTRHNRIDRPCATQKPSYSRRSDRSPRRNSKVHYSPCTTSIVG